MLINFHTHIFINICGEKNIINITIICINHDNKMAVKGEKWVFFIKLLFIYFSDNEELHKHLVKTLTFFLLVGQM